MINLRFTHIAAVLSYAFLAACGQTDTSTKSPDGYDLANPQKFNMPESLLEISGIQFSKANSDTVYAVQDEEGIIFRLRPGDDRAKHTKFSKSGDYEDLAILKDQMFVLKSNGTIFSFTKPTGEEAGTVNEIKGALPKGEYEGMFADESDNRLYVLCKNCKTDKGTSESTGYVLKVESPDKLVMEKTFVVNAGDAENSSGKKNSRFQPSALSKNPRTGEWFILSSANNSLVVCDAEFKTKAVYDLNSGSFLQPEGIAFDIHNNLYISNEGDELSTGNILKFVYSAQKARKQ